MSAGVAIVGIWVLAMAGHWYLQSLKMTADKVRAYMESVDFADLTGDARARALQKLEDELNALSYEERQKLRMQHLMDKWFNAMTDAEKSQFLAATLPTGFKQMINAFQQLPDDKRKRLIDNTLNNIQNQEAQQASAGGGGGGGGIGGGGGNGTNAISPELEAQIRTIGLNTFYSSSSAETKAELAPVLEELQHQMEAGRVIMRHQ